MHTINQGPGESLHGNEASFTQSAAGEYGKAGKGNEVETGNREWKRKLEIGTVGISTVYIGVVVIIASTQAYVVGNSTVYCGIWE